MARRALPVWVRAEHAALCSGTDDAPETMRERNLQQEDTDVQVSCPVEATGLNEPLKERR